jgi:hypothetical protein
MDQNEKPANDKISKLENEIKVLKNEVQAVLLDLRESYLNMENPFNSAAAPAAVQPIVINQQAQPKDQKPGAQPEEAERGPESTTAEKASLPEDIRTAGLDLETPGKEAKMPPISQLLTEMESRPLKPCELDNRNKPRLDLITVAGLTGWVEESTKKLGKERTEAVLDISEAMGYLSGPLRPILLKLISLAPQTPVESATKTRDYLDSLIKLNSLFGKDTRDESALLLLSLVTGDQIRG